MRVYGRGEDNPNWRGGLHDKTCVVCANAFQVKRANKSARHCSLQCVGISQRGKGRGWSMVEKACLVCAAPFSVPKAHADRHHCCSKPCSFKRRSLISSGPGNANWAGGLSRLPYPWNFRDISKSVIKRDGGVCQSPACTGRDHRMTTHHINYDKSDCRDQNLIALCSSCNSKANSGRARWQALYEGIMAARGGGWKEEAF